MQKIYLTALFFFLSVWQVSAQKTQVNNAYQAGELLTYRVYYSSALGDFTAGTAIVKVEDFKKGNTDMFHVIGTGSTKGFFDWFFKVRDRFDSYIVKQTLLPDKFLRFTNEGSFHFEDEVEFNRKENLAYSSRDTVRTPPDVHDIVSSIFFLRTLSLDDFDQDSMYYISFFLDDSVYNSAIRYVGKGVLETRQGSIPCIKVAPRMATGTVFSEKYPMLVWITDDENKIPVFAESKIIVGSVKMELIKYEGLKHPFIEPIKKKRD